MSRWLILTQNLSILIDLILTSCIGQKLGITHIFTKFKLVRFPGIFVGIFSKRTTKQTNLWCPFLPCSWHPLYSSPIRFLDHLGSHWSLVTPVSRCTNAGSCIMGFGWTHKRDKEGRKIGEKVKKDETGGNMFRARKRSSEGDDD